MIENIKSRFIKNSDKKRSLSPRDVVKAFSRPDVRFGQNSRGAYVFSTSVRKSGGEVSVVLLAADGGPAVIEGAINTTFDSLQKGESPTDLGGGYWDLRSVLDGQTSGNIWVHGCKTGGQLAFCFLASRGWEIEMSEKEAIAAFTKILETKLSPFQGVS